MEVDTLDSTPVEHEKPSKTLKLSDFHAENDSSEAIERAKEAYIAQRLAERRAEAEGTQQTSTQSTNAIGAAPAPRVFSDAEIMKSVMQPAGGARTTDESERGERWLAGVTEVALPVSHRLLNIERTERARLDLLQRREAAIREEVFEKDDVAVDRGNYNANFRKHKRNWDAQGGLDDAVAAELARDEVEMDESNKKLVYDKRLGRAISNMSKPSHDIQALQKFKKMS
jgi:hypothetical protein